MMDLPAWVRQEIEKFDAPPTGKVVIVLERYMGGITNLEIGGAVRVKPNVSRRPPSAETALRQSTPVPVERGAR